MKQSFTLPFTPVVVGISFILFLIFTGGSIRLHDETIFLFLLCISPMLGPASLGYYFQDNKLVHALIYTSFGLANLYGLYTIYESVTCTEKLCGLIMIFGFLVSAASVLGLFCYHHHFTRYSFKKLVGRVLHLVLSLIGVLAIYYCLTYLLQQLF